LGITAILTTIFGAYLIIKLRPHPLPHHLNGVEKCKE
jgi:hypothetical protein